MDGTEIAESMGPQDTGKALELPFSHCRRVCCVCSDVRLERAHPGALMQSASEGCFSKGSLSLLQKDGPEPFLAPVASTSELIERVYLELWSCDGCVFFPSLSFFHLSSCFWDWHWGAVGKSPRLMPSKSFLKSHQSLQTHLCAFYVCTSHHVIMPPFSWRRCPVAAVEMPSLLK